MSNWEVDREEIINAIDTLGLVPSRPGISSSEFMCIKPKKNRIKLAMASEVSGYSEAKGKGTWPFKDDIYIDRRLFDPFINAAKLISSKSNFKFSRSGKKEMTVVNGSRKAKFTCSEPVKGYVDIGNLLSHEVKVEKEFSNMMLAARECAESETAVPEHNCVYIKRNGSNALLYATNSLLVFKAEVRSKLRLKHPLPFPLFLISLFSDKRIKSMEATKREVVLDFGNGKIWQTIAVAANKKFPIKKIDDWINKERKNAKFYFKLKAKNFGVVIERMAGYLGSVRRLDWVLKVRGKQGENKIEVEVPLGHTIFRDKIKINNSIPKDFEVDWPFDRVIGILAVIAQTQRTISVSFDKDNRAYVKTEEIELLIPRRSN